MNSRIALLNVLLYIGYFLKSFWYATVSVCELLVYLFAMGVAVVYLHNTGYIDMINLTQIQLMELVDIVFSYWQLFWLGFFFTKLWETTRYNLAFDNEERGFEQ